jgi:hypothetical protein
MEAQKKATDPKDMNVKELEALLQRKQMEANIKNAQEQKLKMQDARTEELKAKIFLRRYACLCVSFCLEGTCLFFFFGLGIVVALDLQLFSFYFLHMF